MSYKRNQSRYSKKGRIKKLKIFAYKETIKEFIKYPEKLLEFGYGIKLYEYQKIFLRILCKTYRKRGLW